MGLVFTHPAWLWALPTLGVPLVLHLLARQRRPPAEFPPAALLADGARAAAARLRLRELLQLAARLLLLAAAVLCFSRPLVTGLARPGGPEPGAAADRPPLGLVVLIDDSSSMSRPADPAKPGAGAARLDRAREEACRAIGELGPGSEAAVVFASGRHLGPLPPGAAAAALAGPAQTDPQADFARALSAAPDFLEAMQPLPGAVLVVSDFEAGAVPDAELSALRRRAPTALVDVGAAGAGDDWAVLSARLDRRRLTAGEPAAVVAVVSRIGPLRPIGPMPTATRRLELVLGGVAVAWRDAELAPGAEADVELEFTAPAGAQLGFLRLAGADPWPLNYRRPVALCAEPPPRVAVVGPARAVAGGRPAGLLSAEVVRLALAPGPGAERKAFLAEAFTPETFAAVEDFSSFRAFFLVGPPALPAAAAERLARAAGGSGAGIVVLAGDPGALAALAAKLNLPTAAAAPVELSGGARLVASPAGADFFEGWAESGRANCFRRALRLSEDGAHLLARLRSDREELPGIAERSLGSAPVLVLPTLAERGWSDLAARENAGFFVPLIHELAARAAGLAGAGLWSAPGAPVAMRVAERERGAAFFLVDAGGLRRPSGRAGGDLRLDFAAPAEPGAYALVSELDGAVLSRRGLAVGLPAEELAGRRPDPSDRSDPSDPSDRSAGGAAAIERLTAGRREGRELAGWLAALALAAMAAELILARLVPGGPAADDADVQGSAAARAKRGRAEP